MAAQDPLPGHVNYYLGPPSDWRTGLSQYSRLSYRSLYPGIDLVFHGTPSNWATS
jgi:hypothetical protein